MQIHLLRLVYIHFITKRRTYTTHFDNKQGFVYNEPYGVMGCIAPWEFPAAMIIKIAPALSGCNCLKTFRTAPLTALALGKLAKANFPKGILKIVCGDPKIISDEHEIHIKKISLLALQPLASL